MSHVIDLGGQRFGRLLVIERAASKSQARWVCLCDCGQSRTVLSQGLRAGRTQSCGCLVRERAATLNYRHGQSRVPEYQIWGAMKARCLRPTTRNYADYGGRGITVDPRWIASFEAFYADMGPRPTVHHSIDRVDNDGPYAPGNCVWAERKVQMRNKRSNRLLTRAGRTMPISAWAEELGIPAYTIRYRLMSGMTDEMALSV